MRRGVHLLVVAVLVSGTATLAVAGGPQARAQDEVPEPALVVPGAEVDGMVTLAPPTQQAVDGRVTWVLANGGDDELTFELDVREVTSTDDGLSLGPERPDLRLGTEQLRLAAGEQARLRLPIPDGTTPGALALVASTVDAEPATEVSALAVVGELATVEPSLVGAGDGGVVTVRLDTSGPALVDVVVRARAWPGLAGTPRRIDDVVVPEGGRDLAVELQGTMVGRVTVEAAVSGTNTVAALTTWRWPRPVAGAAAGALVLLAGLAVFREFRRRRRPRTLPPDR